LGGHLEVEYVSRVVLHDVQDARATADGPGRRQHLVRHRGGENLAGTGRVEHPVTDEAAVQGLMSRAAAGHQADLAGCRATYPGDHLGLDIDAERRMRRGKASQRVGDHGLWSVDELLHDRLSPILIAPSAAAALEAAAGSESAGARPVSSACARDLASPR